MMEKTIEVKNLNINYRTMEPIKLKQLLIRIYHILILMNTVII
jgi:hypothetical protein